MLYHWAALAFPPRVEEDMLNFERIFRHDCRISVTKILVSGFPSFMGKFATSGDGVHTSVHVSQLVGGKSFAVSCESRCIFLQRGTLLYHSTTYGRKNIATCVDEVHISMHISQDIAKLRQFPTSWERSSALVPKPLPFVAKRGGSDSARCSMLR